MHARHGLRNVLASLLPLVNSSAPLISGVQDYQNAPVERECSLLRALSAVAAEQSRIDPSSTAAAVEAALQVARRLLGSYLYQWPTQRTKTQAALTNLLAAAAGTGQATAAAAAGSSGSSSSSSVLLTVVVESLVRDLLSFTLRQLTADELMNGPIIITDNKAAATPDTKPWHIYKALWVALLNPGSSSSSSSSSTAVPTDPVITRALCDALMEAVLTALHPAAAYVLTPAAAAAASTAAAATGTAAAAGHDRKAAASMRLAAATQDLVDARPPPAAAAAARSVKKRAFSTSSSSSSAVSASLPVSGVGRYLPSSGTAAAAAGDDSSSSNAVDGDVHCDESVLRGYDDLTGFMADLLPAVHPDLIQPWTYPLSLSLVAAATLNPHITGLYLLADSTLAVAHSAGLLLNPGSSSSSSSRVEQEQVTELYRNFLPHVVGSLEVLTENSLHAALQLLLSPAALLLLPQELHLGPLKLALRVGLTSPAVAAVAVAALEALEQQQQQLKDLVPVIVPLLNPYLMNVDLESSPSNDASNNGTEILSPDQEDDQAVDDEQSNSQNNMLFNSVNAVSDIARAVMAERRQAAAVTGGRLRSKTDNKQGLAALQPRILLWLGRQGGPAAAALAAAAAAARTGSSSSGSSSPDQVWCDIPLIGIHTAFPSEVGGSVNLEVYIDGLLPHLVTVSTTDSSRARRIAAFEAMHAVALWLIGNLANTAEQLPGTAASSSDDSSSTAAAAASQFSSVCGRLWPVLLHLAAAGDTVAWQLFGALLDQIVHWLGSVSDPEGAAATVMIDSLLDAMCGSSSSGGSSSSNSDVNIVQPNGKAAAGSSSSSSRTLVQLSSLLYGEFFKYAVTKSVTSTKASAGVTMSRLGRQLLVRLLDRLGHLSVDEVTGAAEGLAAAARSLSYNMLVTQPLESTLLVEAHVIEIIRRLVMALAAPTAAAAAGPRSHTTAAAAAIRRALAVILQQWLPVCLDQLVLPAAAAAAAADLSTSLLGQLLSWLWPLTASAASDQRHTAQQMITILAQELLAAAAEGDGAAAAAAAAAGGGIMQVDGQSAVAAWLLNVHSSSSMSQQQQHLRQMLLLPPSAATPPDILTAALNVQQPATAAAAAAGSRAAVVSWLRGVTAAADWCCWALDQGLLDVSELNWQVRRLNPAPTVIDGVALLLLLLPDLVTGTRWGFSSGGLLLAAAGAAEVQQSVLVTLDLLRRLLGSGVYESARDRVLQQQQQQQQHQQQGFGETAAAAAAAGVGSVGRLCLIGLLTPEKLGFTAAEVTAKSKLDAAISDLLSAASQQQRDVLQQLQDDLVTLLQQVVIPQLTSVAAGASSSGSSSREAGLKEPGLSAVTRIMKGVILVLNLLPSPISWPGGNLLAPGGQQLQADLAQASLNLALTLVGLHNPTAAAAAAAGGGAAAGSSLRAPPQIEEAADSALQLSLQLGIPASELLSLLLQPSTAGQRFHHTFTKRLQTWTIFNADEVLPELLAAVAAPAAAAAAELEQNASITAAADDDSSGLIHAAAAAEQLLLGCIGSLIPPPSTAAAAAGSSVRQNIRTAAFLGSLFTSLPLLQPLLFPSAPFESRSSLFKIIRSLLDLDPDRALNPTTNTPAFGFLVDAYTLLLSRGHSSVQEQQLRSQAVRMLGPVLVPLQQQQLAAAAAGGGSSSSDDVSAAVSGIESALQEIAINEWGTTARIDRRSPASIAYRDQLLGIADALMATTKAAAAAAAAGIGATTATAAAAVPIKLINILLQELQKMGVLLEPKPARAAMIALRHPYHDQLELRLAVAAAAAWSRQQTPMQQQQQQQQQVRDGSSVDDPPAAKRARLTQDPNAPITAAAAATQDPAAAATVSSVAQQLLNYCWDCAVLDVKSYTLPLRLALLHYVMMPLLELAPDQQMRAHWYEQHIMQLKTAAETGTCIGSSSSSGGDADEKAEARRLGTRLAAYRLLEFMYDVISKEHLESVVSLLPKKHATLVTQATKDARELVAVHTSNEVLARAVRIAAYAAAVTLLRATQAKASLFAPAFKGAKGQCSTDMFANLLDVQGLANISFDELEAISSSSSSGWAAAAGAGRRTQRRQQELQAMRQASAAARYTGSSSSSQLFSIDGGMLSLSSQVLQGGGGGGGSSLLSTQTAAAAAAAAASQAGGSILLQASISATTASSSQPAAAAAAAGDDDDQDQAAADDQMQSMTISSWSDVDALQANLAASGVTLNPEDYVSLATALKPGLVIDDYYDAHPAMLPLVRLIEKAMTLPADIQGDMPAWLSLMVEILESSPASSESLDPKPQQPIKCFILKAILHVEIRARQTRQQQQQQLAAWRDTAAAAEAANLPPPPLPDFAAASSSDGSSSLADIEVYVSDTMLAQFAERLFPGMVSALLPAAVPGSSSSSSNRDARFHYVLRDFVLVILMWPKLFERVSDDGPLLYESEIVPAATALLRHLAAAGFDHSDATATRHNMRYITELMKRWGSRVTITGDDVIRHVAPPAAATGPGSRSAAAAAAVRGSRSFGGSSSSSDKRVLYGLELLGQAVGRGQTAELMKKSDAARRLWSTLLHQLQLPKLTPTRALLLGRTTALLLLGLLKTEQRQAAAAAVAAAGGPSVRGVVELQISSKLVAAEFSDSMRLLFNSGKPEALIKMLEGANSILATAASAAAAPSSSSSSSTTDARTAAAELLWAGGSVDVLQWLVAALSKVEMQYKGIALGLLLQRCSTTTAAAVRLAEQLPQLATSTLSYSRSTAVQQAAMQLANLLLLHMTTAAAAADFALSQVPAFLQHNKVHCRKQLMHLLIQAWKLLDAHKIAAGSSGDTTAAAAQQQQQLESALLVLACDNFAALRAAAAAAFWHDTGSIATGPATGRSHTVVLPEYPGPRLTSLLLKITNLKADLKQIWEKYSSSGDAASIAARICRDAEQQWPCAAAALLLLLPTHVGGSWDSKIFTRNLGSSNFRDYPVQTQAGATFAAFGGSDSISASISQVTTPSQPAAAAAGGSLVGAAAAAAGSSGVSLSDVLLQSAEASRLSALGLLPAAAYGGSSVAAGYTAAAAAAGSSVTLGLTQPAAGPARGFLRRAQAARRISRYAATPGSSNNSSFMQSLSGSSSQSYSEAADQSTKDLRSLDYARSRRSGYKISSSSRSSSRYGGQGAEYRKLELRRQQQAAAAAAARAANIRLIRSYRTGEYPDIEAVTPKSILGPLTVLASQRAAVANPLLAAVLGSLVAAAGSSDDGAAAAGGHRSSRGGRVDGRARTVMKAELAALRQALSAAFAAAPRGPAYVDALQQLAAADRSLWINPDHLLQAAEASGGLGAAAVQVEEQMMYADPTGQGRITESAATAYKQRGSTLYPLTPILITQPDDAAAAATAAAAAAGSSVNEPEPAGCWRVLADLYDQLSDPDVLGLVRITHLIKCPGTVKALQQSASGRHRLAYNLYDALLDDAVNVASQIKAQRDAGQQPEKAAWYGDMLGAVAVPSKCEEGFVFSERLHCMEQLELWPMIQEQVEADVNPDPDDESSQPNLSELFTSPNKEIRDYLLPYVRACLLSGESGHAALTASGWGLVATAEQNKTWLQDLQETAGVELAVLQLLTGGAEACKSKLTDSLTAFCTRWSSTASSSLTALQAAAATLQPAAELQELLTLLQCTSSDSSSSNARLQQLLLSWSRRWPQIDISNSSQLLLIMGMRRQLLQALAKPQIIPDRQQRQQLAISSKVAISDLQLHAADQLLHSLCVDSARVLLDQHSSNALLLQQQQQQQGAFSGALGSFDDLRMRGCIAAAALSVVQLHSSPDDTDSVKILTRDLQALGAYTTAARKQANQLSSSGGSSSSQHLLSAHALVTEAAAASALAKHLLQQQAAAAGSGNQDSDIQQHFSLAMQDYGSALSLLMKQQDHNADLSGSSGSSSSSISNKCKPATVMLDFGLLCSYLHQQQKQQQEESTTPAAAAAAYPAPAAALVSTSGGLAALAVKHLLAAMAAAGSSSVTAPLHVPTVLAAMAPTASSSSGSSSSSSAACDAFAAGWSAVPLHVLLPWASQLLARLGSVEGEVLVGPLEALAERFPQRMYLPSKMSQQHWQQHNRHHQQQHHKSSSSAPSTPAAAAAAAALKRSRNLQDLLSGPSLGDLPAFVTALDALTGPKQRLLPWESLMVAAFNAGDKNEVMRLWRDEVYPDIIGKFLATNNLDPQQQTVPRGRRTRQAETSNQRFARDKEVTQVISRFGGPSGSQLANLATASFRQLWSVMTKVAVKLDQEVAGRMAVERFTSWFGNFAEQQGSNRAPLLMPKMLSLSNATAFAAEYTTTTTTPTSSATASSAVIPGAAFVTSNSQSAVTIHDFGKYVTTFSSKQKPKLVTIYGSDFREHKFVVKGGEDARLDERVEQLFVVMSGLAAEHTGCVSRGLHNSLLTYDVIPATPRLGLLSFVEGTSPMGSMITSVLSPAVQESAHKAYVHGLPHKSASAGGGIDMKSYERAWSTKTDEYMINCLKKAESYIPWDALRHVLRRRASHPESWLLMRRTYSNTLAVSSTAGYLVGLGDRHLGNLLVVEGTGAVVPIDFGYSFGTAVLALPVAELPPFRLTRQLCNVLQPYDAVGLLQPAMEAWLDAAMEGQQVLGSILEVFLAEPLGEWQRESGPLAQLAMAAAAAEGGDDEGQQQAAAVQQLNIADLKVNQVLKRIAGHNPVGIICAEAQAKHGATPAWPAMERTIRGAAAAASGGGKRSCIRQQLPSQGLTPGGAGNVAKVLLELATDDAILSRSYEGWRPYL